MGPAHVAKLQVVQYIRPEIGSRRDNDRFIANLFREVGGIVDMMMPDQYHQLRHYMDGVWEAKHWRDTPMGLSMLTTSLAEMALFQQGLVFCETVGVTMQDLEQKIFPDEPLKCWLSCLPTPAPLDDPDRPTLWGVNGMAIDSSSHLLYAFMRDLASLGVSQHVTLLTLVLTYALYDLLYINMPLI
jgi:hypothetical protein